MRAAAQTAAGSVPSDVHDFSRSLSGWAARNYGNSRVEFEEGVSLRMGITQYSEVSAEYASCVFLCSLVECLL